MAVSPDDPMQADTYCKDARAATPAIHKTGGVIWPSLSRVSASDGRVSDETILAALLIVLTPTSAFAWGQTGHRVTGAIAEPMLSRRAAREVRAILGNETLAEASTWADEMRSNPDTFWQTTANPWHYVTVPTGQRYADLGAPAEGDAVTALARFAETLRNPSASGEEKRLALRFTLHIIGDLHQPLHAGNGNDRGGNDIRVTFFREPTNLHAVWD
jgi:S1/P1 Nuclease